jgi:YHS domain-containing protein
VKEKGARFQSVAGEENYYFCSEDCKQEFEAEPEAYVERAA